MIKLEPWIINEWEKAIKDDKLGHIGKYCFFRYLLSDPKFEETLFNEFDRFDITVKEQEESLKIFFSFSTFEDALIKPMECVGNSLVNLSQWLDDTAVNQLFLNPDWDNWFFTDNTPFKSDDFYKTLFKNSNKENVYGAAIDATLCFACRGYYTVDNIWNFVGFEKKWIGNSDEIKLDFTKAIKSAWAFRIYYLFTRGFIALDLNEKEYQQTLINIKLFIEEELSLSDEMFIERNGKTRLVSLYKKVPELSQNNDRKVLFNGRELNSNETLFFLALIKRIINFDIYEDEKEAKVIEEEIFPYIEKINVRDGFNNLSSLILDMIQQAGDEYKDIHTLRQFKTYLHELLLMDGYVVRLMFRAASRRYNDAVVMANIK